METFGTLAENGRNLYLLTLEKPDFHPVAPEQPIAHFACLIACDARRHSTKTISLFVEKLLDLGGVYFCPWGPDSERVQDIIDEIAAYPKNKARRSQGQLIMTSRHVDETLAEAVYFFLNCTSTADGNEKTLTSALAVSIGSDAWENEIRTYLSDPEGFSDNFIYRTQLDKTQAMLFRNQAGWCPASNHFAMGQEDEYGQEIISR